MQKHHAMTQLRISMDKHVYASDNKTCLHW